MDSLIRLLAAFCFTELIHNMIEIWGMRQKVRWLKLSLRGVQHGRWPINIDTKFKTILLHSIIWLGCVGILLIFFNFLKVSNSDLIIISLLAIFTSYIYTTWKVDKFHIEIGEVIKDVKRH
jgi:hypothetical protein